MQPDSPSVPATPTPAEAWKRLREGNLRFISESTDHPNQDAARRASLVATQNPFAVIFGCSDSRLAAEIIFDVGLGDVFVVRTAGHVIDPAALGSLEYAVEMLNVPLVVVLGHDSCGAVTATVDSVDHGHMPPGFIRDLVERIAPSVLAARQAGITDIDDHVVEHVKQTTDRLPDKSKIIAAAVEDGRTAVVGLAYHLADGKAELVHHVGSI